MPSEQYRRRRRPATLEQYRARRAHLEEILLYLGRRTPRFVDWELVLVFYIAKHLVCEHILLRGDDVPGSHQKTETYLRWHLRKIYDNYRKLYRLSIVARYHVEEEVTPGMLEVARALYKRIAAALP